jgi:hypothetical protein
VDKIQRLSPAGFADFRQLRRVGRVPSVRFYPLETAEKSQAEFDDFARLDIRIGRIVEVAPFA